MACFTAIFNFCGAKQAQEIGAQEFMLEFQRQWQKQSSDFHYSMFLLSDALMLDQRNNDSSALRAYDKGTKIILDNFYGLSSLTLILSEIEEFLAGNMRAEYVASAKKLREEGKISIQGIDFQNFSSGEESDLLSLFAFLSKAMKEVASSARSHYSVLSHYRSLVVENRLHDEVFLKALLEDKKLHELSESEKFLADQMSALGGIISSFGWSTQTISMASGVSYKECQKQ